MWQRFTRSLKTAFKGRFVASKQPPGGQVRTLLSYSSSPTTVSNTFSSIKQFGQPIFRSYSSLPFLSPSTKFHLPSNSAELCLPRPPSIPGRVTDVGLGTARKFSTARPIFHHLIENVPVAGRAFYEFDIDSDAKKKSYIDFKPFHFAKEKQDTQTLKAIPEIQPQRWLEKTSLPEPVTCEPSEDQFDNYFTSPSPQFSVVTFLQIPLIPSPRSPSSPFPVASHDKTPNFWDGFPSLHSSYITSEQALYSTHSARVSSLYDRLRANHVWEHDVSCEALYDSSSGLYFSLRIRFQGWIEHDVRSILGLTSDDMNWCTLWQEESFDTTHHHQPFIMPTLDLSSVSEPGGSSDAWEECWSNEAITLSDLDLIDHQPGVEEWAMDCDMNGSLQDLTRDLSTFNPESVGRNAFHRYSRI